MPRCKVTRELIGSRRARAAALAKRREGLKKKARELATLCGVRVAVVSADGEGAAPPDVWESEEGVLAAYRALPAAARAAHTHRAYAAAELGKEEAKLARVRQGGPAALQRWDKALDGLGPEEAARVLGDVDAALAAVEERRRALGMPAGHDDDGGLLEGVAPFRRAAAPCGGSSFVDYPLGALGDGDANVGRYDLAMWGNNGVHQYPSGSGADMDGYQMQMAAGMNGYSDTTDTRVVAWDAFQQTHPGYASSQCHGGMSGYRTQHVPSNGGLLQPNPHNALGYPSLDVGLSYIDTTAGYNTQRYGGGSFINAPPPPSHAMGTSDSFMNPAPAQPLAVYAGGYAAQWPAQQQLQSASSSQQSGIEQLHYFSDVEDKQLHLWGN